MLSLEYLAGDLGISSKVKIHSGNRYSAGTKARQAAHAANLAIGLKEALNL